MQEIKRVVEESDLLDGTYGFARGLNTCLVDPYVHIGMEDCELYERRDLVGAAQDVCITQNEITTTEYTCP